MKNRLKNILLSHKKKNGIITLCTIAICIFISANLVSCSKSKSHDAPTTARNFITAFYEVKDYKYVDNLTSTWNKLNLDPQKYLIADSTGNLLTPSEEGCKELDTVSFKGMENLISSELKDNLLANRTSPIANDLKAQEGNYTTEITDITLTEINSSDHIKNYGYTTTVKFIYEDNTENKKTFTGTISMSKENNAWIISNFK